MNRLFLLCTRNADVNTWYGVWLLYVDSKRQTWHCTCFLLAMSVSRKQKYAIAPLTSASDTVDTLRPVLAAIPVDAQQ